MSAARGRENDVRTRRRVVTLVGFFALLLASGTACIFEESDYQGGGHQDQGAEGTTAVPTGSATAPATEPTLSPTSTPDSATYPVFDAPTGG